jgi:SAM-dependent methyltransferase
MTFTDAVVPPAASFTQHALPRVAAERGDVLGAVFAALGAQADPKWAWENYKRVIADLCRALGAKRIVEIGGGRDPLFSRAEIETLGVDMMVNDISADELAVLPAGYRTACFDVAGDIENVAHLRGSLDLAFSRMVFEHVEDGQRAWANLYELLAPGGVALAFIPTLYSVPFVINWLLPDDLAASIVKALFANRTDDGEPVFPARYSWCFASEGRMRPMLAGIGYREISILPFYGHDYYVPFPIVRDLHAYFTKFARARDWRTLASYAYIAVRK